MLGGVVRQSVDLTAIGTALSDLSTGLTFTKVAATERGGILEVTANGIELTTNGSGGQTGQDIWLADYTPPVADFWIESNHPAGSTPSGTPSLNVIIHQDTSNNNYECVGFSGSSNKWRNLLASSSGSNVGGGVVNDTSANPETVEASFRLERLSSTKLSLRVAGNPTSNSNNFVNALSSAANTIVKIGIGAHGASAGAYIEYFAIAWRQILYLSKRYFFTGDSVTVTGQALGASAGVVTLRANQDGTGTSVTQTQTAWAADSVTFTVVQGALTTGVAYLFIESTDGNVTTTGYRVVVGEGVPGKAGFLVENIIPDAAGVITSNFADMGTNTSDILLTSSDKIIITDNSAVESRVYSAGNLVTSTATISYNLDAAENDTECATETPEGRLVVGGEDNSNCFMHVFDLPDFTSSITISPNQTITPIEAGGDNNSGSEGKFSIPSTGEVGILREGEQANTTMKCIIVKMPLNIYTDFHFNDLDENSNPYIVATEHFNAETAFAGIVTDLSGGYYDELNNVVVACSHTSSKSIQFDPKGDGTVLSYYDLPPGHQFEGFSKTDKEGNNYLAVSELNKSIAFTYPAAATPHDLAAGNEVVQGVVSSAAIVQVHALSGSNLTSVLSATVAAIVQSHLLFSASVSSAASAPSASISQIHNLVASNALSVTSATSGALGAVVSHDLAAANSVCVSGVSVGALSQSHLLVGESCSVDAEGSIGAVAQTHSLGADDAISYLSISSGEVSAGVVYNLTADNLLLASVASSGAVSQVHSLGADDARSVVDVSSALLVQVHELVSTNGISVASATTGAVSVSFVYNLTADNLLSLVSSSSAAVSQTHLVDADALLINSVATGAAIVQVHNLFSSASTVVTSATVGAVYESAMADLDVDLITVVSTTRRFDVVSKTPRFNVSNFS